MHLLNRGVHSENPRFSPKCTLHNMDYRQKMVVAPTQKHINDDDDDEDLEALRLAALQSLRAKDTLQSRPQPLPPAQTIIQTNTLPTRGFYKAQRPPARRAFYPHRPQRQNGGPYFQISCNPNLITIVPVEENAVLQPSETAPHRKCEEAGTLVEKDTSGESKFCRYKDDASASEEEDDGDNRNDTVMNTKSEDTAEKDIIDAEDESTDKENQSAPEESPQRSENEEDDDDVLLMADLEEEDSLERLMDEMEREMNVDKPLEKKEKKPVKKDSRESKKDSRAPARKDREPAKKDSREHLKKDREFKQNEETDRTQKDKTKVEQGRSNRSSTPTVPSSPPSSFSKNEQRPLSPYNVNRPIHKRRSLSPKLRSRKKSPRRSPRRSPVRLIKKSQREPLRYRSPRKTPPRFSPRPRSPRLSPRLRSPRLSPRRSPNRSPPRRSPLRLSPRKLSPRSRSPRLSPRLRSPRGPRSRSPRLSPRPRSPRLPRSRSPRMSPRPRSPRLPRSRSPRLSPRRSPRRSPMRLSPRARSPKLSPRPRSPRLSPRRFTDRPRSPRTSPRRISPRMRSPRLSPRRLSPRPRSPRLSPRRLSPRSRSPRISPRRISPRPRSPRLSPHRSPWSSPRNSPRLSPRRRRSPKELPRRTRPRSVTPDRPVSPLFKREPSPNVRTRKSPEPLRSKTKQREEPAEKVPVTDAVKDSSDVMTDPVLEARRRKFECTKPIDPITANKKIKLSKKDNSSKKVETEGTENLAVNVRKVKRNTEEYEAVETELFSDVEYDIEISEEPVDDSSVATVANSVNVCTDVEPAKLERDKPSKKKKKKDKEIYQVNKLKGELPLSERIGKDKKCKKRKDVPTDSPNEETDMVVEEVPVDEEGDLRAELSRRRAERLNRAAPTHQQSARLLQSAFKGVVNEVAKSNAKVNRRQIVKSDEKSNQKGVRRVTVLHRPASDLHESEDEAPLDSKVPVRFRLGLNKAVQDTRESKASRKNSKRQGRKVKHKNNLSLTDADLPL